MLAYILKLLSCWGVMVNHNYRRERELIWSLRVINSHFLVIYFSVMKTMWVSTLPSSEKKSYCKLRYSSTIRSIQLWQRRLRGLVFRILTVVISKRFRWKRRRITYFERERERNQRIVLQNTKWSLKKKLLWNRWP